MKIGERMEIKSINELKKIDMHCHLEGCFNPLWIKRYKHEIDGLKNVSDLEIDKSYLVKTKEDLFYKTKYTYPFYKDLSYISKLLYFMGESYRRQNVRYVEIRFNTNKIKKIGYEYIKVFSHINLVLEEIFLKLDVKMKILLGIRADKSEYSIYEDFLMAEDLYRNNLICGVDINGDENFIDIKLISRYISQLAPKINITVHAGEFRGINYIWEVIENCSVDRISHALEIHKDERLVEEISKKNIHLEFCLTSNIKTGAIKNIREHPLNFILSKDLNFSLNSDNPGYLDTDINNEYLIASKSFGLIEEDFQRMYLRSKESRFFYKYEERR